MIRAEQQAREHLEAFSRLNPDNVDNPDNLLYLLTGVSRHIGKIIKGLWVTPPLGDYSEDTYMYDPRHVIGCTLSTTTTSGCILEIIINPDDDAIIIFRKPTKQLEPFTSIVIPGDQQIDAISTTPRAEWAYTQYAAINHGPATAAHLPFFGQTHDKRSPTTGYFKILNQALGEFIEATAR